ncbi:MAG TPA: phage portal protein [Sphingomicrobium sp.]|nr:phage portal protein [Sphingomicrobium sp.]
MGWWFGRKSAPETRPLVPAWLSRAGDEEGFAVSYSSQFDEIYRRNPVGQRAVRLLSGLLGSLPVYAAEGPSTGSGQGDAAVKLVSADGLLENIGAALLLHGNAYVQLLADADEKPAELAFLRPDRVTVETDSRGWTTGYKYQVGQHTTRIAKTDGLGRMLVAHLRSLSPRDDHYGMGCMDAAIAAASVHNRASRWNKGLLDNAARPSGAMSYEPNDGAPLSDEQFDRLKNELELGFSGSSNAGRPMLLEGGLKWQALSLTPADMDFVSLKEGAARDIALAFGVPPVLVGLPGDATYANAREAGRALYRQTILPMAARILDGLSAILSDWMGPVRLAADPDQISELAEDRALLWQQVSSADFLSEAEKRDMVGFGPKKGEQ